MERNLLWRLEFTICNDAIAHLTALLGTHLNYICWPFRKKPQLSVVSTIFTIRAEPPSHSLEMQQREGFFLIEILF